MSALERQPGDVEAERFQPGLKALHPLEGQHRIPPTVRDEDGEMAAPREMVGPPFLVNGRPADQD